MHALLVIASAILFPVYVKAKKRRSKKNRADSASSEVDDYIDSHQDYSSRSYSPSHQTHGILPANESTHHRSSTRPDPNAKSASVSRQQQQHQHSEFDTPPPYSR